jgi:hypothetical protein
MNPPRSPRTRVVLVDFDWSDADLMPRLLAHPGVSIRLVAGEGPESAGLRLAEMCGLPRTTDLGDLTREIFDVAVVSEHSSRRIQVEGLLNALGTPSMTPNEFLGEQANGSAVPKPEPENLKPGQLEVQAAALESALSGRDLDALLAEALPAENAASAPSPPAPKPPRRPILQELNLEEFPSPEDRQGLENALRAMVASTGAAHAEVRVSSADALEVVATVGPSDPMTEALVQIAMREGRSQVVKSLVGTRQGMAWGAWPFRTTQRRAVVAATGFEPQEGWRVWQNLVEELREVWDQRDRAQVGPAFPLLPQRRSGWLDREEFLSSLELALERHRRDGLHFTLHRMQFGLSGPAVDSLCDALPQHLRDRDSLVRPEPRVVLALTAGSRDAFVHARRRILDLWERCWREAGQVPPAPDVQMDSLELTSAELGPSFLATAKGWLGVAG